MQQNVTIRSGLTNNGCDHEIPGTLPHALENVISPFLRKATRNFPLFNGDLQQGKRANSLIYLTICMDLIFFSSYGI